MSAPVILVIDDSATIRKMVDSHLSQEGYRVILAPTGERGLELARDMKPDLILLDHQLPGTTGIEVCRQIIAFPECRHIPFVVSSTLRKQAYVEYMDVPNVVDSLPKPFKPELLKMAVANALETAAMIISSQANGTAVPEVVGETDQPAFSGDFRWLGLREVLDFLNNGRKEGLLEIETSRNRVCFFLKDGRIQGVTSPSFNPEHVASQLPESLRELSPLLQFTLSSGATTQIDGLVELMDRKVLDPRMLRTLLRHQAAVLTRYCFLNNPVSFAFLPQRTAPSLFRKASIDCCLVAILVDGAVQCSTGADSAASGERAWVRNSLRGQNLDRTGLAARHAQLLSCIESAPRTTAELAAKSGLPPQETRQVLEGFLLADWVEAAAASVSSPAPTKTLVAFESDAESAAAIRGVLETGTTGWSGHVVRDELSFELLLKRKHPQLVLVALQGDNELELPPQLNRKLILGGDWQVVLLPPARTTPLAASLSSLPVLHRPLSAAELVRILSRQGARIPVAPETPGSAVTERFRSLDPAGVH